MKKMMELLERIEFIEDSRQRAKVRHRMIDIIIIVLLAVLSGADDWVEIGIFAKSHEKYLRQYVKLESGVPSHDTIQRVMALVSPEHMQELMTAWQEIVNAGKEEELRKILSIDGKTMRGNRKNDEKPQHIVSAYCHEYGYCMGQEAVEVKSNEITAIPKLLDKINVQNCVVTTDAMGTQTAIAEKIKAKGGDYTLALKGNQSSLHDDVRDYFADEELCNKIKKDGAYKLTRENAHSQVEVREYYQTEDVNWLPQKKNWKGLKSIGMERKTIERRDGTTTVDYRYFISSIEEDIELFRRSVRQHWSVEVMHWHLDVTFREDANHTIDKISARNLNIVRKFCLSILKMVEVLMPRLSIKKKRFAIGQDVEHLLDQVLRC